MPTIVERANAEHPYEVPCVIATPVVVGNPAYVQWVLDETAASQAHRQCDPPTYPRHISAR
ncbi:divalent cation tolerance protein CutA [Micromonospora sp. CPCC 205711]|uniref:divalent cation tolerance protein CutA n=1 Tax=Micromonospora sp. CPCC 205547 TaxID=3122400 RepID=UPI002FF02061